ERVDRPGAAGLGHAECIEVRTAALVAAALREAGAGRRGPVARGQRAAHVDRLTRDVHAPAVHEHAIAVLIDVGIVVVARRAFAKVGGVREGLARAGHVRRARVRTERGPADALAEQDAHADATAAAELN